MSPRNEQSTDPRRSEALLVRAMVAGDESAFASFCDEYVPRLYRFASRRLRGQQELTQDVVQSTVCSAIAKIDSFRGEAALFTWLCACCRTEIAGHYRQLARQGQSVSPDPELDDDEAVFGPDPSEGPEGRLFGGEDAALVHAALDDLPPHYAHALEWKYLEELPVAQIAERLGLGAKAAESILTRARLAFRRAFSRLTATPGNPHHETV